MVLSVNRKLEYNKSIDYLLYSTYISLEAAQRNFALSIIRRLLNFAIRRVTNRLLNKSNSFLKLLITLKEKSHEVDKKQGIRLIEYLTKLIDNTEKHNLFLLKEKNDYKSNELIEVNYSIISVCKETISIVEDKIYPNSYYGLTINSLASDWNNPENDIWDTF